MLQMRAVSLTDPGEQLILNCEVSNCHCVARRVFFSCSCICVHGRWQVIAGPCSHPLCCSSFTALEIKSASLAFILTIIVGRHESHTDNTRSPVMLDLVPLLLQVAGRHDNGNLATSLP